MEGEREGAIAWSAAELARTYRKATGTNGSGNRIICPAHGDMESEDNCTIFELEDSGAIWANCHSQGCDPQDILAYLYEAIGVDADDAGTAPPDTESDNGAGSGYARWAPNTRVDDWPDFRRKSEIYWLPRKSGTNGVMETRYPVNDGVCTRTGCKRSHTGNSKCITSRGRASNAVVGMWSQAIPEMGSVVYWCEGPKDAIRLAKMGYPAVAGPGGAKHGGSCDYSVLVGWKVVLCADNDDPGVRCALEAEQAMLVAGVDVQGFTRLVGKMSESPADLEFADMVEVLSNWTNRARWLESCNLPIIVEKAGTQTLLTALIAMGWGFRYDIMQDIRWVHYGDDVWHIVNRQTVAEINRRIASRLHKPSGESSEPIELTISTTYELLELGCLRPENGVVVAWDEVLKPVIDGERREVLRMSDVVREIYGVELSELETEGLNLLLPHLVWRVWRLWAMAKEGEVIPGGENWQQRIVPILYDQRGGIGKSTLINALLGDSGKWVETMTLDEVDAKTYVEKTKSALIVNFDDFELLRGREFGRLKKFVTDEKDTVRLAYRKDAETFPRVGMLVASTNKKRVLADEDNTRFMYVDLDSAEAGVHGGTVRDYLNQDGVRDSLIQTAWEDCQIQDWRPYLEPRLVEVLRDSSRERQWTQDGVENSGIQSLLDQLHEAEIDGEFEPIVEPHSVMVKIWNPKDEGFGKHTKRKHMIPGLPYVLMSDFCLALYGNSPTTGRAAAHVMDMLDKLEIPYTPSEPVHLDLGSGKKVWRRYRIVFL